MGTFIGHIVPGFALTLLGLWHTVNTIRSYFLKGPSNFRVRFWYPLNCPFPKIKHLELIFILSFSVFAIIMQVLDFPFLNFSFKLHNLEHATMFLHLAIFAGFTLSAEFINSFQIISGVVGLLTASVFCQELFLLHFHSTDHVGLEEHYHWLLQLIVFAMRQGWCFTIFFVNDPICSIILFVQKDIHRRLDKEHHLGFVENCCFRSVEPLWIKWSSPTRAGFKLGR
ncbi:uncharacterized protein LOC133724689 isoform X4 [Rosa rugosa]|uniref:uncharacterized protein LOC133724689 isoform X4 n=1 Tax=Rosa rugosa TaxID=74645 RepID=UPI002B41467B|nr:uncharacterized protein LOC133724689 isoform X4 [Rosa rugosa]